MSSSSFKYRDFFNGDTVMVIVPHEDDEINVAGATIYGAIKEGLHVFLVYVTNGDFQYKADIRYKEVTRMASIMNLPMENIHFLGFPDNSGKELLATRDRVFINHAGFSETHGSYGIIDYPTQYMGGPLSYTYNNLVLAIKDIIGRFKPSTIIAIDEDVHVDHQLTSIAVEESICKVVKENSNYTPKVLKSFAYDTDFESINDYYAMHLQSTVQNRAWIVTDFLSTNNPMLLWEDRIRIPVPPDCRSLSLVGNPMFRALGAHMSQSSYKHGPKLINGDQIFWQRRTDNLVLHATVTATSGNISKINDFLRYDSYDVTKKIANPEDYTWIPDDTDQESTVTIRFDEPTEIKYINWFENVWFSNDIGQALQGTTIKTSTGLEINIPPYYYPHFEVFPYIKKYIFEQPITIDWISFTVMKPKGVMSGISEIEIYPPNNQFPTYCHIVCNEQFAYDWVVYPGESLPSISVYGDSVIDNKDFTFFVDGKSMDYKLMIETLPMLIKNKSVTIRYGNHQMYHEIVLKQGNQWDYIIRKCINIYNKISYVLYKSKYRIGFNLAQKYRYKGF
ncbi:PIG-L family deacetylase [Veillonella sp.]|uniref:PIG-L deacetylase family protein n=1 Tax=Veillonella sp. TaxID=1926307 RepID=UPI002909DD42|nr:PIG-L family deacetylase [Veillonella sp.]MDU5966933.1 PIG-L family deacetylase [Veillonella sp.]